MRACENESEVMRIASTQHSSYEDEEEADEEVAER